jgi:PDZ domain-containing protein
MLLAMVGIVAFGLSPAPYAIEMPGPVYNTIGTTHVSGKTVPVISIPSQTTHSTSGALDMLTVDVTGDPTQPPSWAQIASAWFDPSQSVIPMDELYPPNVSVQNTNKQSAAEMTQSQQDATAAALYELGIKFTSTLTVAQTIAGSPAASVLKAGDIILSVNGSQPVDSAQLHEMVLANGVTKPMSVQFRRAGAKKTAQIKPSPSGGPDPQPQVGVYLTEAFSFPFPVKIQLQDVGGPSAGQMFALGIIDKLTDGQLNGGKHVAGTGTITASGTVGAIGGIRQKMYGARSAGATYFLAPASNCGGSDGVRGHIPAGLTVFATSTLKQSIADLKAIASGTGLGSLPTCSKK